MAVSDVAESFEHLGSDISYVLFVILWLTKLSAGQITGDVGRREGAPGSISVALSP